MVHFVPNEGAKIQYHPDDFLRLMEAIEDIGGAFLPVRCKPKRFRLKQPAAGGKTRWKDFTTAGCGQESLFEIPYTLPEGKVGEKMQERGGGTVRVCAVDDDVGKWPKFQNAMQEDSY